MVQFPEQVQRDETPGRSAVREGGGRRAGPGTVGRSQTHPPVTPPSRVRSRDGEKGQEAPALGETPGGAGAPRQLSLKGGVCRLK